MEKNELKNETNSDDLSFKQGMDKLEQIVSLLESGDLELEDSLKKYSEGITLLSNLQKKLVEAEQTVEVLMGQLEDAPDDEIQDTTLLNA